MKRSYDSPAYRGYALALLVVVYVFNFIDRSILGILVEPIKADLGVSDTAMGFLGGVAFAIFYTFMGIPIARIADRGVRRNVLAVCLATWSAATALCGAAGNFVHLLLARIGVAVGEAGGSPPAHSMISDMFPPESRATALAIYALGDSHRQPCWVTGWEATSTSGSTGVPHSSSSALRGCCSRCSCA